MNEILKTEISQLESFLPRAEARCERLVAEIDPGKQTDATRIARQLVSYVKMSLATANDELRALAS